MVLYFTECIKRVRTRDPSFPLSPNPSGEKFWKKFEFFQGTTPKMKRLKKSVLIRCCQSHLGHLLQISKKMGQKWAYSKDQTVLAKMRPLLWILVSLKLKVDNWTEILLHRGRRPSLEYFHPRVAKPQLASLTFVQGPKRWSVAMVQNEKVMDLSQFWSKTPATFSDVFFIKSSAKNPRVAKKNFVFFMVKKRVFTFWGAQILGFLRGLAPKMIQTPRNFYPTLSRLGADWGTKKLRKQTPGGFKREAQSRPFWTPFWFWGFGFTVRLKRVFTFHGLIGSQNDRLPPNVRYPQKFRKTVS